MALVKYFVVIFLSATLITASVTWITNKGLKHSGMDFYGKLNAAGNTANNTNLLLVGSSRVLKQLDPVIIDSITGLNSFNYGLNAGTIKTWYNIMKYAIAYQKEIKLIVLNVDYNMFDISKDPYKDAYYYPFSDNTAYHELVLTDSGKINLVHRSRIFDVSLYDDYAKYAAIDGLVRPNRVAAGVFKGYFPNRDLNTFEVLSSPVNEKHEIVVAEKGVKIFQDCITLCKHHNIQLVLVIAPYFKEYSPEKYYSNFNAIIDTVDQIAKRSNVPLYNFVNTEMANDRQYFYNVNHLNSRGATLYSAAVADSVKEYLKNDSSY
jgi:hypothetical protein